MALLIYYRPVSILQIHKYSPTFPGRALSSFLYAQPELAPDSLKAIIFSVLHLLPMAQKVGFPKHSQESS
jgi:hypothetical protein